MSKIWTCPQCAETTRFKGLCRSCSDYDADGNLVGNLKMPIKVGIVGGSLQANPAAQLGLKITAASTSNELAIIMGMKKSNLYVGYWRMIFYD